MELRYPTAFQAFQSGGITGVALSYLGTAVFANRFWLWPDLNVPNSPFWTLSFEAFYYLAIAILVFARGRGRILSILVLVLIAGPSMVLLAPTWLAGYLAYHVSRRWQADGRSVIPLWLVSLALLPLCSFFELYFPEHVAFLRTPHQAIGALLSACRGHVFRRQRARVQCFLRPRRTVLGTYRGHHPLVGFDDICVIPVSSTCTIVVHGVSCARQIVSGSAGFAGRGQFSGGGDPRPLL